MLGSLKKPFSVIGISETWLTDCTAELVNITGYNFVSNHRKSKTGGGVGIYLQNDLQYKLLNECKLSEIQRQLSLYSWRLQFPMGKTSLLDLCIDRQIKTAFSLDKFNYILSRIAKDNKQCYVMGDFNVDLLQYNQFIHQLKNLSTLYFCTHLFLSSPIQRTSPLILQLYSIIYSQIIFLKMF